MSSRTTMHKLTPRLTRQVTSRVLPSLRPNPTSQLILQLTPPSKQPQPQPIHQTRPLSSTPLLRQQPPSSTPPPESDPPPSITAYSFTTLSTLVSNPSPSRIIIDVREPSELQHSGRIPGAQNMPINSAPDGLFLPADEFEDRFGFEKPAAETEVVFYCKAGVRSRAAARVARMAGWERVGEYPGSWVDWERNGGEVEK